MNAAPSMTPPSVKQRKVRKGTQSCWECKRRKVRCIFASAEHAICNNCRRRGTACISQEFPDIPRNTSGDGLSGQIDARLDRFERLVEQLSHNAATGQPLVKQSITPLGIRPPVAIPARNVTGALVPEIARRHEELSRELIAAWPSEDDLEIITSLPVGLSIPLFWRDCAPYDGHAGDEPPSARTILKLPPAGCHPVLIARKLLLLATFLQGVLPSAIQKLEDLGISYHAVMARAVDRATRLVTSNDELVGSAEGVVSVMLESLYQNYAGNLHLAWMAMRRAISAAQIIGMQRNSSLPSTKFVDPATRAAFDAGRVCFRLVQMDHYLSLMLGLPQNKPEGRFSIPEDLSQFDHIERLERLHCLISGRIVQRADVDINDLSNIRAIDKMLQSAAAEMPPQWWLTPSFSHDSEVLNDTVRLMIQLTHHHLLARLHLPYMLLPSTDHRYDYSKITAVNASREMLSRYTVFRSTNPAHYYCRGCDFLAFVALTVMCLAHISSRSEQPGLGNVFCSLTHSHPVDRGMMERTTDILESMARHNSTDAIAPKLTRIMRHLLDAEANAARGTKYSTTSSSSDGDEGEINGSLSQEGKALRIHIPYFGTINIEHGSVSKSSLDLYPTMPGENEIRRPLNQFENPGTPSADGLRCWQPNYEGQDFAGIGFPEVDATTPSPLFGIEEDWDLQGIDIALFDSLFRGIEAPDTAAEDS
ncbi:hypothetical protein BDV18DRAFT_44997 [Aspergillus unguis]